MNRSVGGDLDDDEIPVLPSSKQAIGLSRAERRTDLQSRARSPGKTCARVGLTTTAFAPPVDIYEDEHNITLKIEVPGIDEKDIDVRIENNTLTVHGERKFGKEEKEENFCRVERQYGGFTRSFTLPSSADPGQVSADYDKGVLKINLAKKAEAKPKQIKVNVRGEKTLEAKAHSKVA
jgi:HSP20 family protein